MWDVEAEGGSLPARRQNAVGGEAERRDLSRAGDVEICGVERGGAFPGEGFQMERAVRGEMEAPHPRPLSHRPPAPGRGAPPPGPLSIATCLALLFSPSPGGWEGDGRGGPRGEIEVGRVNSRVGDWLVRHGDPAGHSIVDIDQLVRLASLMQEHVQVTDIVGWALTMSTRPSPLKSPTGQTNSAHSSWLPRGDCPGVPWGPRRRSGSGSRSAARPHEHSDGRAFRGRGR